MSEAPGQSTTGDRIAKIALVISIISVLFQGWSFYQTRSADHRIREQNVNLYAYAAQLRELDPTFGVDCADFAPGGDAQAFFDAGRQVHGARADQFQLDSNGNGTACDIIFDGSTGYIWEDAASGQADGGTRGWWMTDKNCQAFPDRRKAEALFRALGGRHFDPFNFDQDRDGEACEPFP